MHHTLEANGCVKCYTLIKCGFEKRLIPGMLQAGAAGHQARTACAYFNLGSRACAEPESACLRIFVNAGRVCGSRETVCIQPILPCGAPLTVKERASFEVARGFCGWKKADVLPLITAIRRELGCAPFGLALSVAAPSLIMISAEPATCPRLLLDWSCALDGCHVLPGCPCSEAVDICAPVSCGCCADGSGMRLESQVWHIEFEGEDSSVMRRVDRIKEGTFFVTNTGEAELLTTVETGFDSSRWAHDTQKNVAPGETQAIVAKFFGRYYRLTLSAPGTGKATVEFIGQYYA